MNDTRQEQEPGTEVETDREEQLVDGSLILAGFPSELLVILAEKLGNPLALLVSKAHLSKAFREAARNAQGLLKHAGLHRWARTVDDAAVASVVSKCTQLSSLHLHGCGRITDAAMLAVASECEQLMSLNLACCYDLTDAAVVAVASGCKQLTTLYLPFCNITDAAVVALASGCKRLTALNLGGCSNITDAAVVAVTSECKQLASLDLWGCRITDSAKAKIPNTVHVES